MVQLDRGSRSSSRAALECQSIGGALLVHPAGKINPQLHAFAGGLAHDPEHTLVVVDLPEDPPAEDWESVASLLKRRGRSFRLIIGRPSRETAMTAGQLLADRLERTVLTPDGWVLPAAGGVLFVPEAAGSGWLGFQPRRSSAWARLGPTKRAPQVSRRFPVPKWEHAVPEASFATSPNGTAEPVPGGVWVRRTDQPVSEQDVHRRRLTASLLCQSDRLVVVLGCPGGANLSVEDIERFWGRVAPAARPLVRFTAYGPVAVPKGTALGQVLADRFGQQVTVYAGLPTVGEPGTDGAQIRVLATDGTPGPPAFVRELVYRPAAAPGSAAPPPELRGRRRPADGLPEVSSGVYEYAPDAVLEVTQSGLWLRPPAAACDAPAVHRVPADPGMTVIHFDAGTPESAERMRTLAEELRQKLDPTLTESCRVLPAPKDAIEKNSGAASSRRGGAGASGAAAGVAGPGPLAGEPAQVADVRAPVPGGGVSDASGSGVGEPGLSIEVPGAARPAAGEPSGASGVQEPGSRSAAGRTGPAAEAPGAVVGEHGLAAESVASTPDRIGPAGGVPGADGGVSGPAGGVPGPATGIPGTTSGVPGADGGASAPASDVPGPSAEMPGTASGVPGAGNGVSTPAGADVRGPATSGVPGTEGGVPGTQGGAPGAAGAVSSAALAPGAHGGAPGPEGGVSRTASGMPGADGSVPGTEGGVPSPDPAPVVGASGAAGSAPELAVGRSGAAAEVLEPTPVPVAGEPGSAPATSAGGPPDGAAPVDPAASGGRQAQASMPAPAPLRPRSLRLESAPPAGAASAESAEAAPACAGTVDPEPVTDPAPRAAAPRPAPQPTAASSPAPPPAAAPTSARTPTPPPPPGPAAAPAPPGTPAPAPAPTPAARPKAQRPAVRMQPVPAPDACAVPPARGIEQERTWLRRTLKEQYDSASNHVARVLSEAPGLRGGSKQSADDVVTDLVAVRLYLSGGTDRIDSAVRGATVGPHVPLARCVASGLRRLPSYRGATLLRTTLSEAEWQWYGKRRLVTEWAFCAALTAAHPEMAGDVDVLIWSMTARRTALLDPTVPDRVLYLPGTSFKVLGVRDEERRVLLLRELTGPEIGADGSVDIRRLPLDDLAMTRLEQADTEWRDAKPAVRLPATALGALRNPPGLIVTGRGAGTAPPRKGTTP
ncbi:hypothetical protein QQM39_38910 [Streptomyces sp. DT2A-34]|uniref:hypothetical protein n=1 Tax=Streptomyces sp. DT2A-34 TaxID=3051182 RepID=UPI00265BDD75|nr:hypothetical protein [Streptomyces sp. DT2A-34]MDO0916583.1 hypothetical protein [Streptomyces sp. DT2A-34]